MYQANLALLMYTDRKMIPITHIVTDNQLLTGTNMKYFEFS